MLSPRPLISLSYAETLLDMNGRAIVELTESGLLPGFDISSRRNPRHHSRELRLVFAGLVYYAATKRPLPADPEDIISDLVPPDMQPTTVTLRSTLNCSPEMVRWLVVSKTISLIPGQVMKRGPAGMAKVNRKSVLDFLLSRVL